MLARCEANDREPRLTVAERGHRRVPPAGMLVAPSFPERDQPRAQGAVARRLGVGDRRQICGLKDPRGHCERRSDEAIQAARSWIPAPRTLCKCRRVPLLIAIATGLKRSL